MNLAFIDVYTFRDEKKKTSRDMPLLHVISKEREKG